MDYGLPTSVTIGGHNFPVRYDFRVIMDIFEAINDPDMDDQERVIAVLTMFYPDYKNLPDCEEAVKKLFWFINGGEEAADRRRGPKLMDWQQDYRLIIAPINPVLGQETRSIHKTKYSKTEEELFAQWLGMKGATDGQNHDGQRPQEN